MAPFVNFINIAVKPLRIVLTTITLYLSRALFFFLKKEKSLTIEELEHVIKESKDKKILTPEETDLIRGYLALLSSKRIGNSMALLKMNRCLSRPPAGSSRLRKTRAK